MDKLKNFLCLSAMLQMLAASELSPATNEYNCWQSGDFGDQKDPTKYYHCTHMSRYDPRLVSFTYYCPGSMCFDRASSSTCSTRACGYSLDSTVNDTMDEELKCLKDHLKQDAQIICEEDTLKVLKMQLPKMLEFTAFRGDAYENLKLSLRDVNFMMRENYKKMIENVGKNVFPLIIITDAEPGYFGVGGVIKVYYRDGSMQRIVPALDASFEIHKSLSHMVLAVFAIVSPYFKDPTSINWKGPLTAFLHKVGDVLNIIDRFDADPSGDRISSDEVKWAKEMLEKVMTYIETALKENSVNYENYRSFANDMTPLIEKSMARAAKAHAEDTVEALLELKGQMGVKLFREAYVIIPTVWPVSMYNIRLQALEKVMLQ